jgi:hypothetical protein
MEILFTFFHAFFEDSFISIIYSVIGEPPSSSDGSHLMVNDVLVIPETSNGPLGALGSFWGNCDTSIILINFEFGEGSLGPIELTANVRNVYSLLVVNSITVCVVVVIFCNTLVQLKIYYNFK